MKRLIRKRTFRALCVLLAVAAPAATLLAQNGPPSKDRYIIVLKPPKNGIPELSDHDITAGGGTIEYKVPGRIQVTLPEPAVEAMRKQERVKYIQKVILGPLPDASAPAKLLMAPSTASLRATAESTPPTWRSGTYKYDASGNIYAIGLAGDTGSPVQHRYAYDELSRLKRADTMTTPTHTETFTYDVYGNLIEHVDGSSTTSTPVEDANTNRLKWSAAHPYTYDAAGNLTADYNASYAYDPVGMLREKDYTNEPAEYYIYTASDERIGVKYGSSSGSPTIWSIRDFSGNILRQYESHDQSPQMAWLWVEDYVYRDGQLLAAERVPEEGGRRHFHLDHLGSPQLVTGQDSKEMSEHDFEPFGLESNPQWQETAGGFDREDPKRFTGHERDYAPPGELPASTAYLDYMHARFYTPNAGRFLSVDPALGNVSEPQSFNRYAYVADNPVLFIDPYGRWECAGVSGCVDSITVTADPMLASGIWGSMGDDQLVQRITARHQSEHNQNEHDRTIPAIQHCAEGTIAPLVVGGGELVAGGAVAYAGYLLAGVGLAEAGPSGGISLSLTAIGGAVVIPFGGWVFANGVSTYINVFNNHTGQHVPSPSSLFPKYFPQYPPPDDHPCHF
jgi:RHS repeat-associated protein